jgi:hypothetical protein
MFRVRHSTLIQLMKLTKSTYLWETCKAEARAGVAGAGAEVKVAIAFIATVEVFNACRCTHSGRPHLTARCSSVALCSSLTLTKHLNPQEAWST